VIHSVAFESQLNNEHKSSGCGAASLIMLLRHHELPIRIPSYGELCECLWLTVAPEIKGCEAKYGRGAYGTDVHRALKGMKSPDGVGIEFSEIKGDDAKHALRRLTKALKCSPVMCAMKGRGFGGEQGHWVVIIGEKNSELHYLDPQIARREVKVVSHTNFHKHWDGCAFFLKQACKCAV
jgi:hypothetical protein